MRYSDNMCFVRPEKDIPNETSIAKDTTDLRVECLYWNELNLATVAKMGYQVS